MAAAWCQRHGYELDTELVLSDQGRSAFKGHHLTRGALGRFLQLAEDGALGSAPVLLIEAIDRVSRQEPLDAIEGVVIRLVRAGVEIVDLEDGQCYSVESLNADPMCLLKLALKAQAAHEYSKRLSRRLSAHWDQVSSKQAAGQRITRGNGGMRPFWLTPDQAADQWLLNDHAKGVARLFELLKTEGLLATADRLNSEGHLGPKAKPWDVSSVRRVATSPAAMGTLERFRTAHDRSVREHSRWSEAKAAAAESGKHINAPEPVIRELVRIENYYPAVVTAGEWQAAQQAMSRRDQNAGGNRRSTGGHFLQGIVQCQGGGLMGVSTSRIKSTGESIRYLVCRNHRRHLPCTCDGKGWKQHHVEAHILTRLDQHLLQKASIPGASRQAETTRLKSQLQAQQSLERAALAAVEKASDMLEQAADSGSLAAVENVTGLLEKRRTALRKSQAETAQIKQQLAVLTAKTKPVARLANESGLRMIAAVAKGEATGQELLSLRDTLRQSELQVALRGSAQQREVGLRFGSSCDFAWEPFNPQARGAAAWLGAVQPAVVYESDDGNKVVFSREPLQPPELAAYLAEHEPLSPAEVAAIEQTGRGSNRS